MRLALADDGQDAAVPTGNGFAQRQGDFNEGRREKVSASRVWIRTLVTNDTDFFFSNTKKIRTSRALQTRALVSTNQASISCTGW